MRDTGDGVPLGNMVAAPEKPYYTDPHGPPSSPLPPMSGAPKSRPPRLPFVADLPEPDADGQRRCFWSVEPTDDFARDCATGGRYGRLAVAEMARLGTGWLLQDIVWAMVRQGDRRHKGLVLGFCAEVERALLAGPVPPAGGDRLH